MRYLFETWKGQRVYFNPTTGQFESERGYSSYSQSSARYAAVNRF